LDQNLDDELHRQMLAYGQRYDIQTGLLNYQSFQESLAVLLRNAEPGQEFALVWIDLLNCAGSSRCGLEGSRGPGAACVEFFTHRGRCGFAAGPFRRSLFPGRDGGFQI